jgi:hypothetical protein
MGSNPGGNGHSGLDGALSPPIEVVRLPVCVESEREVDLQMPVEQTEEGKQALIDSARTKGQRPRGWHFEVIGESEGQLSGAGGAQRRLKRQMSVPATVDGPLVWSRLRRPEVDVGLKRQA